MPPAPWPRLDLGSRRVVWPSAPDDRPISRGGPELPPRADFAYCPAATASPDALERQVAVLAEAGCPALVHVGAGDRVDGLPAGSIVVWDLFDALLGGGGPGLAGLDPAPLTGAKLWIAVPLLPGLLVDEADLLSTLESLRRFQPEAVVGIAPDLAPVDRRRLSEVLGEDRYEEVFHGQALSERSFAAAARGVGLDWRPPRPPLVGQAPRLARNRELAAVLAEAGELWLRLGREEPEGFALAAAAHHVDEVSLDIMALAREGNLEVLGWLSPVARAAVAELAVGGRSSLLAELAAAWSTPPEGPLG